MSLCKQINCKNCKAVNFTSIVPGDVAMFRCKKFKNSSGNKFNVTNIEYYLNLKEINNSGYKNRYIEALLFHKGCPNVKLLKQVYAVEKL